MRSLANAQSHSLRLFVIVSPFGVPFHRRPARWDSKGWQYSRLPVAAASLKLLDDLKKRLERLAIQARKTLRSK